MIGDGTGGMKIRGYVKPYSMTASEISLLSLDSNWFREDVIDLEKGIYYVEFGFDQHGHVPVSDGACIADPLNDFITTAPLIDGTMDVTTIAVGFSE